MSKKFDPPKNRLKKSKKYQVSEFRSYTYIKNELKKMGWNVNNPNRNVNGQLYTQHECHSNNEIYSVLGKLVPEFIIKLNEDLFWVIEAKPTHDNINLAYKEAVSYGKLINKHSFIRAKIVSGVAGNDTDRYLVKSGFWDEKKGKYLPITHNDKEITNLINPDIAETLLLLNSPSLEDYEINEEMYINIAEEINQKFHEASIKKDTRSGIVASILLSLLGDTEPNYNASPKVFVDGINSRAKEMLEKNNKENFFKYIEIHLPEKPDAQKKFKNAIVSAFFLLKKVNIKSAMRAGSDILGKFYEGFLKHGNGAKDLGILLTPRHITEFSAEVLNVTYNDIIYDPTCGTGGFLVSAFYHVKKNSNERQLNNFKKLGIFGIDQQPIISALAIVNMIFRGDGNNNIINDNCLARALAPKIKEGKPSARFISKEKDQNHSEGPITKVLMNPPFALENEKESDFVDHALNQMQDGGLLFSILPVSIMIKRSSKSWRNKLLEKNSLLSVITFPSDLFYQAGSTQNTLGIFVKKGIPHENKQNILWIRAVNDGFSKKKGKRLRDPSVPDYLAKVKSTLQAFIGNPRISVKNIPEFLKAAPIDFNKKTLELVPEVYLDEKKANENEMKKDIEKLVRETVAYLIRSERENES